MRVLVLASVLCLAAGSAYAQCQTYDCSEYAPQGYTYQVQPTDPVGGMFGPYTVTARPAVPSGVYVPDSRVDGVPNYLPPGYHPY